MKKLLLPIDGSPRSLRAIQVVKQSYSPEETEVTILYIPVKLPVEHGRAGAALTGTG